jgi:hypothetical protein
VKDGAGADVHASGATRVAGSMNFKPEHAPNFPQVTIQMARSGRMTNRAELERLGLVAPERQLPAFKTPARFASVRDRSRPWPSYAIALERAPLRHDKSGSDTSSADISLCMFAYQMGWPVDEIARRLMQEPESKASQRGEKYAQETARKAALFVEQRRQQKRRTLG